MHLPWATGITTATAMTEALYVTALLVVLYTAEQLAPYCALPAHRLLHFSRNAALGIVASLSAAAVFAGLVVGAALWSQAAQWGVLTNIAQPYRLILAIIAFDCWMYLWHRINHRVRFLWLFHRVHHADTAMDVSTALRFHPGELILSAFARVPVIIVIGLQPSEIALYEALLHAVVLFHHSNIYLPLPLERALSYFLVMPRFHRVHHDIDFKRANSNFSSVFTLWDRLFGTYQPLTHDAGDVHYGVSELTDDYWQTLPGMLQLPIHTGSKNKTP